MSAEDVEDDTDKDARVMRWLTRANWILTVCLLLSAVSSLVLLRNWVRWDTAVEARLHAIEVILSTPECP